MSSSFLALLPMFKFYVLIPFGGMLALGIFLIRYGIKQKKKFVNR